MALTAAMEKLVADLQQLLEMSSALQVTVVEDRPTENGSALVDQIENSVIELISELSQATEEASLSLRILRSSSDYDGIASGLVGIHRYVHLAGSVYWTRLTCHLAHHQLQAMGHDRGGEWQAWSDIARSAIDQIAPFFERVEESLLRCWGEIADRLDRSRSISIITSRQHHRQAPEPQHCTIK